MALPSPQPASSSPFGAGDIAIYDGFLGPEGQRAVLGFLSGPGWAFGAYSDAGPGASRYWFKHFAGIVRDGAERSDPVEFERQLNETAPPVAKVWSKLRGGVLAGHSLFEMLRKRLSVGLRGRRSHGLEHRRSFYDHILPTTQLASELRRRDCLLQSRGL